jgi:flagellar FliJ protein
MHRFALQSLLTHRKHNEQTRQRELATLENGLTETRQRIEQTVLALKRLQDDIAAEQVGGIGANEAWLYSAYCRRLSTELMARLQELSKVQAACDHKRQELLHAVQQRKMIETLKQNAHRAFIVEDGRRQRRFIDEIAVSGHVRQKSPCQLSDSETEN